MAASHGCGYPLWKVALGGGLVLACSVGGCGCGVAASVVSVSHGSVCRGGAVLWCRRLLSCFCGLRWCSLVWGGVAGPRLWWLAAGAGAVLCAVGRQAAFFFPLLLCFVFGCCLLPGRAPCAIVSFLVGWWQRSGPIGRLRCHSFSHGLAVTQPRPPYFSCPWSLAGGGPCPLWPCAAHRATGIPQHRHVSSLSTRLAMLAGRMQGGRRAAGCCSGTWLQPQFRSPRIHHASELLAGKRVKQAGMSWILSDCRHVTCTATASLPRPLTLHGSPLTAVVGSLWWWVLRCDVLSGTVLRCPPLFPVLGLQSVVVCCWPRAGRNGQRTAVRAAPRPVCPVLAVASVLLLLLRSAALCQAGYRILLHGVLLACGAFAVPFSRRPGLSRVGCLW